MSLKDFFFKKAIENQIKNLPPAYKERVTRALLNNPDFLQRISEEIKKEMDMGKDRIEAAKSVMEKNQSELLNILGEDNLVQ